ncbi:MAG: two-component regulator propeller domain-containing protein, partial [Bacteroidota bacterium]
EYIEVIKTFLYLLAPIKIIDILFSLMTANSIRRSQSWFLRVSFLWLLAAYCSVAPIVSQENKLYVERLGSEQGFSANYVTCAFQDDDGFMWFGTFAGLNRYDGYEVKVYKPDPQNINSISGIRIFSIVDDAKGNLWIGTTGKGLSYYNRSTNKFQRVMHDPKVPHSIPSNTINDLLSDRTGRLWVGTNVGLSVLSNFEEGKEPKFKHLVYEDSTQTKFIDALFEDASGNIWLSY